MNPGMNLEAILSSLFPKIKGAAVNVAQRYDKLDEVDDIEQNIVLAILERFADEPDFLAQAPSYIVQWGVWQARNAIGHGLWLENRTVENVPAGDDGDALLDLVPAEDDGLVEAEIGLAVRQALAGLGEQDRQIAGMLAAGTGPREIGPVVGLHWKTVYNRMGGPIAQALAGCQ